MAGEIDYRTYLNIILQKKILFTIIAIAVCTVGIVTTYLWPQKYEAQSTVFIEKSVINDLVEGIAITQSLEGRLKVLSQMLGSRNLLLKVIDALDVDLVDKNNTNSLIKDFQKNTKITIKDKDLFIIQYANSNPRLARDYVNTLIQKYIEQNLSANRQESYGANRFLSEQMEHFRSKIQEAEGRLAQFKQQESYAVFNDDSYLLTEIRQGEAMLNELETQKTALQAKKSLLNRGSTQGGTSAEHLADLQRRRDQLLLVYTDNYPEVILINAEIEQIRQAIKASGKGEKAPRIAEDASMEGTLLNIELNALVRKEETLKKSLEEKKAILATLPEKHKIYNELLRDRDTYKNTYDQLVLRYGKSELSKQMEIQDKVDAFRIVDAAILPERPVSPNRVAILLMSLLAALGAGFGVIYALHYFDSSVKSIDTVQELGLPVLALIPQFTTTEDQLRQRQQAVTLTVCVAVYLLGYFLVLGYEFLQMVDAPLMDKLLRSMHFRQQVADLGGLFRNIL